MLVADLLGVASEDGLVLFSGGHAFLFSFPIPRFLFRKGGSTTKMLPAKEAWCISGEASFTEVPRETVWKVGWRGVNEARSFACNAKIRSPCPSMLASVAPVWCPSGLSRQSLEEEFSEVPHSTAPIEQIVLCRVSRVHSPAYIRHG